VPTKRSGAVNWVWGRGKQGTTWYLYLHKLSDHLEIIGWLDIVTTTKIQGKETRLRDIRRRLIISIELCEGESRRHSQRGRSRTSEKGEDRWNEEES